MRVIFKGSDITKDISLNYCVHDMYAERESDSVTLRFNDPKGVWSKWNPKTGDDVSFEKDSGKTGKMFIHSLKPENGLYTVRAMSMPISGKVRKSRSWDSLRFLKLANTIASENGLGFKNYGCEDFLYTFMEQRNETDFELFYRVCMLEGCQMLIYDGNLIAYNEQQFEAKPPTGTLDIGDDGVFEYINNSHETYGSAEVSVGKYTGTFNAPRVNNSRILRPNFPIRVNSDAEAVRYAHGLLRNANKNEKRGTFSKDLILGYAAASLTRLSTTKASAFNGTVFISRIRHDYIGNKSRVYFRGILEGY